MSKYRAGNRWLQSLVTVKLFKGALVPADFEVVLNNTSTFRFLLANLDNVRSGQVTGTAKGYR